MNFLCLTLLIGIFILPVLSLDSHGSKKQKSLLKTITSNPKKREILDRHSQKTHVTPKKRKHPQTKNPSKILKHKIQTNVPDESYSHKKNDQLAKDRMNRNKREDFSFLKEIPETMVHENDVLDFYHNRIDTATDGYEWVYEYVDTETEIYELVDDIDTYTEPHNSSIRIPESVKNTSCLSNRDCDSNAECLNYFCFCNENYFGSGKKCCAADDMCFGYGDPHYITFDNLRFDIITDCTYVLATDECYGRNASYKILVEHEMRFNNTFFIKQLHIFLDQDVYRMTTTVNLNNNPLNLPFVSENKRVRFYKEGIFSIMETDEFMLQFDGNKYLKFSECGDRVCGLCGTKNGINVNPKDYLIVNKDKPKCQ